MVDQSSRAQDADPDAQPAALPLEGQDVLVPAGFFDLEAPAAVPEGPAEPVLEFLGGDSVEFVSPEMAARQAEGAEMRMFSVEVAKILLLPRSQAAPKPAWSLSILRSGTAVAATLFAVAFLGSALAVPQLVAPATDLTEPSGSVSYGFDAPKEDKEPKHEDGPGQSEGTSSSSTSTSEDSSPGQGGSEEPHGNADVAVCHGTGSGSITLHLSAVAAAQQVENGISTYGECATSSSSSSSSESSSSSSSTTSSDSSSSSSSSESSSSSSSTSSGSGSSSSSSTGSPGGSDEPHGNADVAVCHDTGSGSLTLYLPAVAAALAVSAGDTPGECPEATPPQNETDEDDGGDGNETGPEGNETIPDGNGTTPDGNETLPDGNETGEPGSDDNETESGNGRGRHGGGSGSRSDEAPVGSSSDASPSSAPAGASGAPAQEPPAPQARPPEEDLPQPEPPGEAVGLPGFVTLGFELSLDATGAGRSRRHHKAPAADGEEPESAEA